MLHMKRWILTCLTGLSLMMAQPQTAYADDGLNAEEQAIVARIEANLNSQIAMIEEVVNINSGSTNVAGVRDVGRVFEKAFSSIGFETEWLNMPAKMKRAGHFVARHKGANGERVMLIGHLDTVFEKDSPFQKFEREGDRVKGPGIGDMKSGDVIAFFALKALHEAGVLDGAQVNVMFTGDEEMVGSPQELSRGPMIAMAKESDVALSFEGGTPDTGVVARRGSSGWRLEVTGKRAHSSGIFSENVGAGAIFEAARILNSFYEQVPEDYLTFNPGFILGGSNVDVDYAQSGGTAYGKTNVVAETVVVNGGLRFLTEEQKTKAREKMLAIATKNLPQTSAKLTFTDGYPSMPPTAGNDRLFDMLKGVNKDLGYGAPIAFPPGQRGAGDIAFVAPYVSGLDGLGGSGSGAHGLSEELDLATLAPMTKRAALLIYRLTR